MKDLIILGTGPSWQDCPCDAELWANASVLLFPKLRDLNYSKVFSIDPLDGYGVRETIRIAQEKCIPMVSPQKYATEIYPLKDILHTLGVRYFSNTISYMIAFAIYKNEYNRLRLYGVDQGPDIQYVGARPFVMFWIGFAMGRGIDVTLAKSSLLRDEMEKDMRTRFLEFTEGQQFPLDKLNNKLLDEINEI